MADRAQEEAGPEAVSGHSRCLSTNIDFERQQMLKYEKYGTKWIPLNSNANAHNAAIQVLLQC